MSLHESVSELSAAQMKFVGMFARSVVEKLPQEDREIAQRTGALKRLANHIQDRAHDAVYAIAADERRSAHGVAERHVEACAEEMRGLLADVATFER